MLGHFLAIVRRVALLGARRPFLAIGIGVALVAISSYLIPSLKISTSRRDLVSTDNPLQKRTVEFDDKFGYTSSPVVVVSGKSAEERRKVVDALETELERIPELKDRVLGRVGPADVAEALLLVDPESITKNLPEGAGPIGGTLEKGLVGWASLLRAELARGLETDAAPDDAKTKEGLDRLGTMFQAMDDELQGTGGLARLSELAPDEGREPLARGLDSQGYLAGEGDHHIVALFPSLSGDEGFELRPVVDAIRTARDRAITEAKVTGVRADVTGVPALAVDELEMVQSDLAKTTIASTLAIIITLYWAFRSFRQSMVSFIPLGFGTIVTFGVIELTLGHLNLITASFASVLLGLGDFGVHIQARYSELLRQGVPSKEAMEQALLKSGPGLVIATLTTGVAFLTTMATEFTAFAELGLITTVGLVLMLAGTYLLVPPAMLLLLGSKPRPAPELAGFRAIERFVKRFPRAIIGTAAALTLLFAVFIPRVEFNGRYFEFLPKSTESARALRELEQDAVVSPFVANVRASSVEEARGFAEKLREMPSVASVESPSDMLPRLDEPRLAALRRLVDLLGKEGGAADYAAAEKAPVDRAALVKELTEVADQLEEVAFTLRNGGKDAKPAEGAKAKLLALREHVEKAPQERLDAVQSTVFGILGRAYRTARQVLERGSYAPSDLPPLFHHRFVSKDGAEVALFVHPKGDVWDVPVAERFTADVTSVSPSASGIATTLAEHPKMIVRGFQRSTLLAAALVLVILYLGFRRVFDVVGSAIPLLIGAVVMSGSIPLMGLAFNHANVVVVPLLLGLGLEASAHIVHRYRESAEENGGVARLSDLLSGTGSAVFVGTLTTVWGFTVMLFADYRAMFHMGLLMTIGKGATLAASLLVLPALLVVMKKAK